MTEESPIDDRALDSLSVAPEAGNAGGYVLHYAASVPAAAQTPFETALTSWCCQAGANRSLGAAGTLAPRRHAGACGAVRHIVPRPVRGVRCRRDADGRQS